MNNGGTPPIADSFGEQVEACALLDEFAIIIQVILGALAFSSLIYKRHRERPQRPLKIWFYDTSKQGTGAILQHCANIAISYLMGQTPGSACVWYFVSLIMDSVVGTFVCWIFIWTTQKCFVKAKCKPCITGSYGVPARCSYWVAQLLMWWAIVIVSKVIVLGLTQLLHDPLEVVGTFLLSPMAAYPKFELVFVMMIAPTICNATVFWIQDSFLKRRAAAKAHRAPAGATDGGNLGDGGNVVMSTDGSTTPALLASADDDGDLSASTSTSTFRSTGGLRRGVLSAELELTERPSLALPVSAPLGGHASDSEDEGVGDQFSPGSRDVGLDVHSQKVPLIPAAAAASNAASAARGAAKSARRSVFSFFSKERHSPREGDPLDDSLMREVGADAVRCAAQSKGNATKKAGPGGGHLALIGLGSESSSSGGGSAGVKAKTSPPVGSTLLGEGAAPSSMLVPPVADPSSSSSSSSSPFAPSSAPFPGGPAGAPVALATPKKRDPRVRKNDPPPRAHAPLGGVPAGADGHGSRGAVSGGILLASAASAGDLGREEALRSPE